MGYPQFNPKHTQSRQCPISIDLLNPQSGSTPLLNPSSAMDIFCTGNFYRPWTLGSALWFPTTMRFGQPSTWTWYMAQSSSECHLILTKPIKRTRMVAGLLKGSSPNSAQVVERLWAPGLALTFLVFAQDLQLDVQPKRLKGGFPNRYRQGSPNAKCQKRPRRARHAVPARRPPTKRFCGECPK